jgi:hypothetical protein
MTTFQNFVNSTGVEWFILLGLILGVLIGEIDFYILKKSSSLKKQ